MCADNVRGFLFFAVIAIRNIASFTLYILGRWRVRERGAGLNEEVPMADVANTAGREYGRPSRMIKSGRPTSSPGRPAFQPYGESLL